MSRKQNRDEDYRSDRKRSKAARAETMRRRQVRAVKYGEATR